MYDLLLKGGTVVDPSAGLDGVHDIAVEGGQIARIAPDIPSTEAARTIAVGGKVVTPGLIDLHAHVFEGVNRTGVNPDLGGVYAGVTTIVDAGSAGSATFGAFPRHIMPSCHTEIVPFLHICQTGLATMPDIIAESSINLGDTLKAVPRRRRFPAGREVLPRRGSRAVHCRRAQEAGYRCRQCPRGRQHRARGHGTARLCRRTTPVPGEQECTRLWSAWPCGGRSRTSTRGNRPLPAEDGRRHCRGDRQRLDGDRRAVSGGSRRVRRHPPLATRGAACYLTDLSNEVQPQQGGCSCPRV